VCRCIWSQKNEARSNTPRSRPVKSIPCSLWLKLLPRLGLPIENLTKEPMAGELEAPATATGPKQEQTAWAGQRAQRRVPIVNLTKELMAGERRTLQSHATELADELEAPATGPKQEQAAGSQVIHVARSPCAVSQTVFRGTKQMLAAVGLKTQSTQAGLVLAFLLPLAEARHTTTMQETGGIDVFGLFMTASITMTVMLAALGLKTCWAWAWAASSGRPSRRSIGTQTDPLFAEEPSGARRSTLAAGSESSEEATRQELQPQQLQILTVDELKMLLRSRGLTVGGTKQVLIQRLAAQR